MIRDVDHVVVAVDESKRRSLAGRLLAAGFVDTMHLDFPEIEAASDSYAMAGGGFVELVYETKRDAAPAAWFDEVPPRHGLGFMSGDFEADPAGWGQPEGLWIMDEDQGSGRRIDAQYSRRRPAPALRRSLCVRHGSS